VVQRKGLSFILRVAFSPGWWLGGAFLFSASSTRRFLPPAGRGFFAAPQLGFTVPFFFSRATALPSHERIASFPQPPCVFFFPLLSLLRLKVIPLVAPRVRVPRRTTLILLPEVLQPAPPSVTESPFLEIPSFFPLLQVCVFSSAFLHGIDFFLRFASCTSLPRSGSALFILARNTCPCVRLRFERRHALFLPALRGIKAPCWHRPFARPRPRCSFFFPTSFCVQECTTPPAEEYPCSRRTLSLGVSSSLRHRGPFGCGETSCLSEFFRRTSPP